jgi:hypothetical protein
VQVTSSWKERSEFLYQCWHGGSSIVIRCQELFFQLCISRNRGCFICIQFYQHCVCVWFHVTVILIYVLIWKGTTDSGFQRHPKPVFTDHHVSASFPDIFRCLMCSVFCRNLWFGWFLDTLRFWQLLTSGAIPLTLTVLSTDFCVCKREGCRLKVVSLSLTR